MNQACGANKKVHLRQCHCFNLRQVTLAVTALYDKYLQEAGITAQQYSILWHSKELGPINYRIGLSHEFGPDDSFPEYYAAYETRIAGNASFYRAAKTRSIDRAGTSCVCAGL